MAQTLIVVRHGKAKEIAPGQQDFERKLTEAGRRSLEATLPHQLACVDASLGRTEVLASPAPRAFETAQIVRRALRKRGVKLEGEVQSADFLWEQDAQALLSYVYESDADAVVAVGHNPMAEELVARLTDARIPFSTGAMACMRLADEVRASEDAQWQLLVRNATSNRLLWFAQGPVSQHWKSLVQLEKTLRSASDNVLSRLDAFMAQPNDVETMHKLRVSIRTLRSLVAFVRPWQDGAQNQLMQDDLKAVVAHTSRLRELDVLCEQAAAADPVSDALVEFCGDQAVRERKRVIEALSERKTQKRLERVRANANDIRWKRHVREEGLAQAEMRAHFDQMASKLEGELAALDLAEVEATHDVRKSAKRVRYAAENFKDMLGEDVVGIAKGMIAQQDKLGAICDARVNIDIINGLAGAANIPEPISWDLALLRAQNETFLYSTLREASSAE